jgi:hypothetical protein
VTVQVPARSHRCRARRAERAHAVLLRRQCRGWRGALRGMLDRWLVCLMRKLRSTCTGCDMLEYARAQMSCLRVFYLSRVADGCRYNTQIRDTVNQHDCARYTARRSRSLHISTGEQLIIYS